ncbi:MAG: Uncharacterized protein Athens101410_277 [Parcubacteria group bacterium Athens1014_10]|nr:MAG: Uncharacterized protein Athens101410_277 [Parcubacteria group bacterium Athens1014_10]TSD04984.1 MAG: Uncharacterized protein Athens071412_526 [Parcubacteria group bacterium Athens0714_12]
MNFKSNIVKIRTIYISDAKKLLKFFHDLVISDSERVERLKDVKKINLQKEIYWIKHRKRAEKNKEMFIFCCEVNGRIVAEGEIEREKRWIEKHVAEIRFGILPGYEKLAIEMIKQLIKKAKENKIKVLIFFHLATQKTALSIMGKLGFSRVGIIKNYYKRDGHYISRVYMVKNF